MEICSVQSKKGGFLRLPPNSYGADNGIRTRDPRLGKPMLYQLSYVRICGGYYIDEAFLWQGEFSEIARDPPDRPAGLLKRFS